MNLSNNQFLNNISKTLPAYYFLTFFYLGLSIIFSLVGLKINLLGEKWFSAKVIIIFFIILTLFSALIPFFTFYLIIPLVFCTFAFIYINKDAYLLESKYNFYTSQRWNDAISAGKTWFIYGSLLAILGLILALVQVQVFQEGIGGLNEQYNKCVVFSKDGSNACLTEITLTKPIGDRLITVINLYAGQAFIFGGLFFVIIKKGSSLNKSFVYLVQSIKENLARKTDKFRKDHYM